MNNLNNWTKINSDNFKYQYYHKNYNIFSKIEKEHTHDDIEKELNKKNIKGWNQKENRIIQIIHINGKKKSVKIHRFIYQIYNESKISGCEICKKDPSIFCVFDNKHDIDHIDGEHSNNNPDNLQRLCHSKKTRKQTQNSHKSRSKKLQVIVEIGGEIWKDKCSNKG